MKKKKAPKKGALVIDKTELMMTTAGKLGKHTPTVQSGTGVQQSKKAYDRKKEKASHRYNDVEDAFYLDEGVSLQFDLRQNLL